ncbi:hypothetical protein Tco_0625773 [Tanacetum coccineum]|uniref:Uncharacterized protein n=1 Tax=Tanacetum coccineum TaxID=301880 RepID=A0ABQ4WHS1_9ASTR
MMRCGVWRGFGLQRGDKEVFGVQVAYKEVMEVLVCLLVDMVVAFDLLRDALSAIFGLSELKEISKHKVQGYIGDFVLESMLKDMVVYVVTIVMSADSAVTYTSVHSEARSWSIPSEFLTRSLPNSLLSSTTFSQSNIPDPWSWRISTRTPPLLPIPLPAPSTSRRADIPEADTPPRKRLLLTTPRPGCEIRES